jgi:large subunit ribosomal protein L6
LSKIGKKPIEIPKNVNVEINGNLISVKGAAGEFKKELPGFLNVEIKDGRILISIRREFKNDNSRNIKKYTAGWGLYSALLKNMLRGASELFRKNLEFEGVGYKANIKPASSASGGEELELNLGYSHPVTVKAPRGITFKVEKNIVSVMGVDKELVGHIAAEIRSKRKPEPYRGSGIKYQGEYIKRKVGKKAATAT